MRLILFNTCGADASVALADTELAERVVALSTMPGRTAAESLVTVVRHTIAHAGWKLVNLDAIVVVTGPGSFTGVRVGLSAAKGLGEAIHAPMIAVSRLAMLAAAAKSSSGRLCALLDAGRGEFYCGQYADGLDLGESLLSRDDGLAAVAAADSVVLCEDVVLKAVPSASQVMMVTEPTAADALPFAMRRLAARLFDDPVKLDANYLRRTDAEIFAKPAKQRAS